MCAIQAAKLSLQMRHNLFNIPASAQLIDQRTQSTQIIGAKARPTGRRLRKQIPLGNIGPRCQYRAQALICVVVHDPILAPILAARHEYETLSSLGMEWMGDLKRRDYRCTAVHMTGS